MASSSSSKRRRDSDDDIPAAFIGPMGHYFPTTPGTQVYGEAHTLIGNWLVEAKNGLQQEILAVWEALVAGKSSKPTVDGDKKDGK